MELDEFKSYWNSIQQKENEKLTSETLDQIIMKTTNTLTEIQQTNAFWTKLATLTCGALVSILLINLVISHFTSLHSPIFGAPTIYVSVMIIFAVASVWFIKWQNRIFLIPVNENLKGALTKTIADFKRFYIVYVLAYLVLFPTYFYSFFKLFMSSLILSTTTMILICGALTVISMLANHWYYKVKYFNRIKLLEDSLKELS